MLEKFIEQFEKKLGQGWTVTPRNVHLQVYYFTCSREEFNTLTGSYGIYDETDFDRIITKEVEAVKRHYRQFQQISGVTS